MLGQRLVAELGLEDSVDTLGRWMAHYVAELIVASEQAPPTEKTARRKACSDAILELWSHKHELPNGKRPFGDAEWLLRLIQQLDPEDERPRYFRSERENLPKALGKQAGKWIALAEGFDSVAKMLVLECLLAADRASVHKAASWLRLAEAAGAQADPPTIAITMLARESGLGVKQLTRTQRATLRNRIKQLTAFTEAAHLLAAGMTNQLRRPRSSKKGKASTKPRHTKKKSRV